MYMCIYIDLSTHTRWPACESVKVKILNLPTSPGGSSLPHRTHLTIAYNDGRACERVKENPIKLPTSPTPPQGTLQIRDPHRSGDPPAHIHFFHPLFPAQLNGQQMEFLLWLSALLEHSGLMSVIAQVMLL